MNFIIKNKAVIVIDRKIEEEMAQEISSFVYGLEFLDEVTDLEVVINSPGGSVMAGFNIYSAIKNSSKKSNTTVEFLSASIATVVMFATDTLTLNEYSNVMIHNPFGGSEKVLKNVKNSIMAVYQGKFGKNVSSMMNKETWLNATQMKNLLGDSLNIIYSKEEVNDKVYNISENDITQIMNLSNEIVKIKYDNMLENNNELVTEDVVEEVTETVTEEVTENEVEVEIENENETETNEEEIENVEEVETEENTEVENEVIENEVENEVETEENQEESVVETEIENEVENEVNVEDLLNRIQALEEENSEMKNQLSEIKETEINENKLEVLENSAIDSNEYDKWMNLDLDTIKNLTSTIKKEIKTPKINFSNEKEIKFSDLTNEEKLDLKENDPKLYSKLFFENK